MKHYQRLKEHLVNYVKVIKFWMPNPISTGQSKEHVSTHIKSFWGCIFKWVTILAEPVWSNAHAHDSKNSNIVKYY